MNRYQTQLINGKIESVSGHREQLLRDPFTGETNREIVFSDLDDLNHAVNTANTAFTSWSRSDSIDRVNVLKTLADALEVRRLDLAEAITAEVGTPAKVSEIVQAGLPVRVLRGFAEEMDRVFQTESIGNSTVSYRPRGVIGAITPWNYPVHQAVAKIGAAIAAGCTIVLKPSELSPQSSELLMAALAEAVPPGVVNVIQGDASIGAALVKHPGVSAVSFTGSVNGGRAVAVSAAEALKPCFLELGGKSAAIVLPDADLDIALKSIVQGGLLNSGQTCSALTRILVPAATFDAIAPKISELVEKMALRLGPLVTQGQLDRVQEFIVRAQASGARLMVGGSVRPEGRGEGYFLLPTVFSSDNPSIEIAQEEIFGPVLTVLTYNSMDDLIAIANGTEYGLAAALWGKDEKMITWVVDRLRAGQIDVNGAAFNPRAPFGGLKNSGWGREMGLHGIREFQYACSVQR